MSNYLRDLWSVHSSALSRLSTILARAPYLVGGRYQRHTARATCRPVWARISSLCAAALMLAACQQGPGFYGAAAQIPSSSSALTEYLAGQQAFFDRDTQLAADYYLAALDFEPSNGVSLRDRTYQLLISDGRFKEADRLSEQLATGSLSYNLSRMVNALSYIKARRYKSVDAALDKVNGTGFDLLLKPITRAWAAIARGDEAAADAALDPLRTYPAFRGFLLEHQGLIAAYAGDWEKAKSAFEDATKDQQLLSRRGVMDYAAHLSREVSPQAAIDLLDTLLEDNPAVFEWQALRETLARGERVAPIVRKPAGGVAEALYRTATELGRKRTATSAVLYARLATYLMPNHAPANLLISEVYAAQDRLEAAYEVVADMDDAGLYETLRVYRASTYLSQLERLDDAVAILNVAAEQAPQDLVIQSSRADLLRRNAQFSEAIAAYDQALLATQEPDWMLFYGRGIAHEQNGNFSMAEADLRKAMELKPDDAFILNYLGYSLLDRGEKVDEAIAMIDRAVKARPNDGFIVDSQGWAAFRLGEYERAVDLLERAVSLQPGDPTINDHLGDAYWKVGRSIEARFKWRQVLDMEPEEDQRKIVSSKLDLGLTVVENSPAINIAQSEMRVAQ